MANETNNSKNTRDNIIEELNENNVNTKGLMDFLIADFKDLSEKLEATDKKVQFCVQLYITIITAILAAIGANLLKGEHNQVYLYISIFMFICSVVGEFIFLYMLSGQRIHFEYVNRLNYIRRIILKNNGKNDDFIKEYGYTNSIKPKRVGMNYYMIYLICLAIPVFAGATQYCLDKQYGDTHFILDFRFIGLIVLFINICIIEYNHKKLEKITTGYEVNNETN